MGLGRAGLRVANMPVKGREKSLRGCVFNIVRSILFILWSQKITTMCENSSIPSKARVNLGNSTIMETVSSKLNRPGCLISLLTIPTGLKLYRIPQV